MAELDRIEAALLAWAHWLTSGGSGAGYPAMSVIHPNWCPPTKGQAPAPKWHGGGDARERATHRAVQALSQRLQHTLVLTYCRRVPLDDRAAALGCAASTVGARVREAKRQLAVTI